MFFMATYLIEKNKLLVDGIATLLAASEIGVLVFEEIIKAKQGSPYQTQDLTYVPMQKAWIDENGRIILFNLKPESQEALVEPVTRGGASLNDVQSYKPLLVADNENIVITDLGNTIEIAR